MNKQQKWILTAALVLIPIIIWVATYNIYNCASQTCTINWLIAIPLGLMFLIGIGIGINNLNSTPTQD